VKQEDVILPTDLKGNACRDGTSSVLPPGSMIVTLLRGRGRVNP
jgi:hypothetical protein